MMKVQGHTAATVVFSLNEAANIHGLTWLDEMEAELAATARDVVRLEGCWKGKPERSYMVTLADYERLRQVAAFHAALDCEQSVLILASGVDANGYREATLRKPHATDGQGEVIGLWGPTSGDIARMRDAWSRRPGAHTYFVVMSADEWRKLRLLENDHGVDVAALGPDWAKAETVWITPTIAQAGEWAALEAAAERRGASVDHIFEDDEGMATHFDWAAARFKDILASFRA